VALCLPLLASGAGYALCQAWQAAGAMPAAWTANAPALQLAIATLALSINLSVAQALLPRLSHAGWLRAALLPLLLLGAFAVLLSPGASYLGLLPALFGFALLLLAPSMPLLAAAAAGICAAITLGPLALSLYTALGASALALLGAIVALASLPVASVLAAATGSALWLRILPWLLTALLAIWAALQSPFDVGTRPQRSLQLIAGDDGTVIALGESMPDGFAESLPGAIGRRQALPWDGSMQWVADSPTSAGLPAPMITVQRGEAEAAAQVRLQLSSARHAPRLGLVLPTAVALGQIRVDGAGIAAPVRGAMADSGPWRVLSLQIEPGRSVTVEFPWPPGGPLEGYVYDLSFGLPEALAELRQARNAVAVPVHNGDIQLRWTRWQAPAADATSSETVPVP